MVRAEFFRQRFLVLATSQRNGFEAHLASVLHTEMAEAADALHRDDVTGARAAVAQRIEDRHARAHEWSGFLRRNLAGNHCQRFRRCDHVFGIATIEVDTGHLAIDAHGKIAAATFIAGEIVATVPADPDAIAGLKDPNSRS